MDGIASRITCLEVGVYDNRNNLPVRLSASSNQQVGSAHAPLVFHEHGNGLPLVPRALSIRYMRSASEASISSSVASDENVLKIRDNAQLFSAVILGMMAWIRDSQLSGTERRSTPRLALQVPLP